MVKSVRAQCIELLTEIEARLDFDDEMPPLDTNQVVNKIHSMSQDVDSALETANYDQLLQSGLQVQLSKWRSKIFFFLFEREMPSMFTFVLYIWQQGYFFYFTAYITRLYEQYYCYLSLYISHCSIDSHMFAFFND